MKIDISPRMHPSRGGEVLVGNVYSNDTTRFLRIVVGVVHEKYRNRGKWNNVVCIHVDPTGDVVGASCQPTLYMQEHQDLVGRCKNMPTLKIEWLRNGEK